ncbi:hypothetical protein Glove_117g477 [Diversispora epigaea]|uniref:Serine-threonine/tyrosine-protein kinase catalytic domain-containing protein n=1 Tax=Diversispora epigaea TaxID=1348612 RepID=A0A397J4H1_9GLOM|nr:hypothetical protein Glove_117g477 [Diversispora epigaea]
MEKCWHKDPSERPSAEMISDISENWVEDLLYDVETEDSLMFLNAEQKMQDEDIDEDLSSVEITHPEANVTSKLLPDLNNNDFVEFQSSFPPGISDLNKINDKTIEYRETKHIMPIIDQLIKNSMMWKLGIENRRKQDDFVEFQSSFPPGISDLNKINDKTIEYRETKHIMPIIDQLIKNSMMWKLGIVRREILKIDPINKKATTPNTIHETQEILLNIRGFGN